MDNKRSVKDVIHQMQNEMKKYFDEMNNGQKAFQTHMNQQMKMLVAELNRDKKEIREEFSNELAAKDALIKKLQAQVDQQRKKSSKDESDLKRKLQDLQLTKLNTSTSSKSTSPESSPDFPAQHNKNAENDLESPIKRPKFDKKKSAQTKIVLLRESPKKKSKHSGWISPIKRNTVSKPKVTSLSRVKVPTPPLKRIEQLPLKSKESIEFEFDNTFDSNPPRFFKGFKAQTKRKEENPFAGLDLFALKPKKKSIEPQKEIIVEKVAPIIIKEEPKSQIIEPKPPTNVYSQDLFPDSDSSVIFQENEPVDIPIYTINESEAICDKKDDGGGYKHLVARKKEDILNFESFFKNHAVQSREIYEGECENCKEYYDQLADEMDIEKVNMEIADCLLDPVCKGFRLRVEAIRKKPNYVPAIQILRANPRIPVTKNREEICYTPEGFWDLNISPVKNQHLKPSKY